MEDFGAQFYFSIAATSFLEFYFSFLSKLFGILITLVAIQRVCRSAREGFKQVGQGECFKVSGPPIKRGMPLSKATDSLFSGGGWGLATNVNAIVVVQWGL